MSTGTDRAAPGPDRQGSGPDADITFEQIRERAYDLWERHHRPEDFGIALWLMAERELRAERDARLRLKDGGDSRGAPRLGGTGEAPIPGRPEKAPA